MKKRVRSLIVVLSFAITNSGCRNAPPEDELTLYPCDSIVVAKFLDMPSVVGDSTDILIFERSSGSTSSVLGSGRTVIPTPNGQFYPECTYEGALLPIVFPGRFGEYPPWGFKYIEGDFGGGVLLSSDNADVARISAYRMPVFRRPSPVPWLQVVVAHELIDSTISGSIAWWRIPDRSVMKIYHRDAILDTLFPAPPPASPFDREGFSALFNCLQRYFDARYPLRYPKEPLITWKDMGREKLCFEDKPYRDLIRHRAWLRPDSVMVELYCFPADPLMKYYWWGGTSDLLFDSMACTYHPVPQGIPGAVDSAWDIMWEDLAIWIVYTDVGMRNMHRNHEAH